MNRTFPAFLQFHHFNNCFGYVKNETLFSSTSKINWNPASLGDLLGCYIVRSCADPNVTLVVQLYGRMPFSHLFVNSVLAKNAGFRENEEVIAEAVDPTNCKGVEVSPVSAEDFEIMDKSSSTVEHLFLDQLTVVKKDMIFPLWLSPSMHVLFKIVNVVPPTDLPVYLVPSSELYVIPFLSKKQNAKKSNSRSSAQMENIFENISTDITSTSSFSKKKIENAILRCLPKVFVEKCKILNQCSHPCLIYCLSKDEQYSSFNIISTKRNNEPHSSLQFAVLIHCPDNNNSSEGIPKAVVSLLKHRPNHFICTNPIYSCYTKIMCNSIDIRKIHALKHCDVFIVDKSSNNVPDYDFKTIERALQTITAFYPVLFGYQGIEISLTDLDPNIVVRLQPSTLDLTKTQYDNNDICFAARNNTNFVHKESENTEVAKLEINESVISNFGLSKGSPTLNLECQSGLVRNISHFAELFYESNNKKHFGHTLLLGKEGTGKSCIVTRVARRLAKSSLCVFSVYIDCCSWKGKQSDSIEKSILSDMKKLEKRQPSLLILDNLDFFQAQGEEEHRQLAIERLFNMLLRVLLESKIPVITTARKLHSLHKSLTAQGSKRIFTNVIEIPTLSQTDRAGVLREFLDPDCNPSTAAKDTDNFTLSDLRRLATRIQLECRVRGSSSINEDDIKTALLCSRPFSSVTEKQKTRSVLLSDVGGMEEQKKLLTEVLIWPTKYSQLYDSCGIKLGRGVLLHGRSGCGKTMLANAFASFTDFNVISIKGPELLSKYIGSSEENVRLVFERARAQAPCVIIFDELDSLAPKRGNDSTGVTDRVVNQLLTELDGAEGLQGVFVIGCTSRIDMIDGALLRPGRFDHLIMCNPPDVKERSAIIRVILKSVNHQKISHTSWAYRTDGWTGADLKALITNAQFNAHRNAPKEVDVDDIAITEEDLESVYEDSRPKDRNVQIATFKAGQNVTLA